jgi:hypothetical protein
MLPFDNFTLTLICLWKAHKLKSEGGKIRHKSVFRGKGPADVVLFTLFTI